MVANLCEKDVLMPCPHARYAHLRAHAPVSEVAPGVWAVTRHADVQRVLRDPAIFSAQVTDSNEFEFFGPSPVMTEIRQIMADYPETPALIRVDPPAHKYVRDVVARVLTPGEVAKFEPGILGIVNDLIAPWIDSGWVEFVGAFSGLLPGIVTTDFLCGDPAMRADFRFWAGEIMSRVGGPQTPERQLEVAHNVAAMGRYFLDRIAERRVAPTDDFISLVANAKAADGMPLPDVAIVNVLETFMVGGNETTTFLLGNAMIRLSEDAALAQRLRDEPVLIPAFVEEMLRLEAPAQSVMRRTTCEVEFDGVIIPAGASILASLVSAGRDASVFVDPDQLHLDRSVTPRHVSFGYGNHACLGLQLARAEARIALEVLLPRMKNIALAPGDAVHWLENDFLRGPVKLDLVFTAQS